MKKLLVALFSLLSVYGFSAETITLNNQTPYPTKIGKIAVQWAADTKEVAAGNSAILHGLKLDSKSMTMITQSGPMTLTPPKKSRYFRVLVWTRQKDEPDLLTNWVDIISGKTYNITPEILVPAVLMAGSGC